MIDDEKITIKWSKPEDAQESLTQIEAMKKLHEFYQQLQEAGFSKSEVLAMIGYMLAGGKGHDR